MGLLITERLARKTGRHDEHDVGAFDRPDPEPELSRARGAAKLQALLDRVPAEARRDPERFGVQLAMHILEAGLDGDSELWNALIRFDRDAERKLLKATTKQCFDVAG